MGKLLMKSCGTCVFCMPGNDGLVCAGRTDIYGMPIDDVEKLYPFGCDFWEISWSEFCRQEMEH